MSQQAKDILAGLYGIDVSAQFKAMGLISVHVSGPRRNKGATLVVRQYKPTTPIELRALAKLKVPRNNNFREKEFHGLVLRHLATIQELGKRPQHEKRSRRARDLRAQVKRVHTAIRRLFEGERALGEDGLPRLQSYDLVEAVRRLNAYSANLEAQAELLRGARRQFRHAVSPQNLKILELVTFVRMVTGEPHWQNLAILLKGATGDAGMNRRRLFQLYKDRENRRVQTFGLFHRARLRAEVGKLRLP